MLGSNIPTVARVIILNSLTVLTPFTAIGYTFVDNGAERIVLDDVQLPSELTVDSFLAWCSDSMKIDSNAIKFVDYHDYHRHIDSYYSSIFKASLEQIDLTRAVNLQKEMEFKLVPCAMGYAFRADNKKADQSCSWIVKTEDAVFHLQHFYDSEPEEVLSFVNDAVTPSTNKAA